MALLISVFAIQIYSSIVVSSEFFLDAVIYPVTPGIAINIIIPNITITAKSSINVNAFCFLFPYSISLLPSPILLSRIQNFKYFYKIFYWMNTIKI